MRNKGVIYCYEMLWNEIPKESWPPAGNICLCYDPQKRLGEKTWSVSIMGDGTSEGDTVQLGLFWRLPKALLFAFAYLRDIGIPIEDIDTRWRFGIKRPNHSG